MEQLVLGRSLQECAFLLLHMGSLLVITCLFLLLQQHNESSLPQNHTLLGTSCFLHVPLHLPNQTVPLPPSPSAFCLGDRHYYLSVSRCEF